MAHNIKSHIQMPKKVLLNFEKNHRLAYYDVEQNFVGKNGHASSINTKPGYYDESIEKDLNRNFETPFSEILNEINKIDINNPKWISNDNKNKIIIDFCVSLLIRNPYIKAKDVFPPYAIYDKAQENDLMIAMGLQVIDESMMQNYFATLTFNKTTIPFVLPVSGLVAIPFVNEEERILFPVTPQIAITLISQKHIEDYRSNGEIIGFEYNDSEFIKYFNELAFKAQCQYEWGYVVCPEKEELDRLKSWWDNENNERQRN